MDYEFFTQSIAEICGHSLVSPGRTLHCTIIINPAAGGFTIRSKWNQHKKTLNEYREKARANPQRELSKKVEAIHTEAKGSGEKITETIIKEAMEKHKAFYLIISAGGDGTHCEVMFALYNAPAHVRSNITVLRLPFGTGNDGSDSASLAGALDLLINPVHVEFAPAVQLITSAGGPADASKPYLAFNILSVGLDAFVTHMTNKMKGKFPGDSYKLWVNIAAMFYDRIFKVDFLDVKALDQQNRVTRSFREKLLLLAMGASGCRTYGSQERILPDDRNVCALKQMPFYRKLAIKGQVSKGRHTSNPEVLIFSANRLEFYGSRSILAQMDGETVRLQPEDFPASMELTAPVIPLLKM
jgi:diacylglycerol kinase family enzyme